MQIVSVQNLTHRFGERTAVDDLTFEIGQGEVFALLGPNGAGKTTTVRLLNGLYEPAAGSMRVLGFDPVSQGAELRRRTGVLTETPALYERLTARQNLEFFAELADMPPADSRARIGELFAFFDLEARSGDKAGTYSKGMKQRLALARAILARPELVFLDEPTAGLDPESAQQVHELIDSLRRRGEHTVFLCTHNLYEAERLCDRVGIMNQGRLLAAGSLDELRQKISPGLWVRIRLRQTFTAWDECLNELGGVISRETTETSAALQVADEAVVAALVSRLAARGAQIVSVQPQTVSLEEIYFTLQNSANHHPGGAL